MARSTELVSGKAEKYMATCPHASYQPASPLHKYPASNSDRQRPTPTASPLPGSGPGGGGGVSVLGETKGKRKNHAGKCWGHEGLEKVSERLHPSPLHPVPSPGNLGEERHTEMEASCKTN